MMRLRVFAFFAGMVGLAACGDKPAFPSEAPVMPSFQTLAQLDLTYRLTLFGGGGQWDIQLQAQLHNLTDSTRQLTLRTSCPVALLAYTNSNATGTPAWDSRIQAGGCDLRMTIDTLRPGDSLTVTGPHTSTNEILAHYGQPPANPAGTYYFFALFPTALAAGGADTTFVGFSALR